MYSQYELESLIAQRHAEALREARTRRLARRAGLGRKRRSERSGVGLAWGRALSLLRPAQLRG